MITFRHFSNVSFGLRSIFEHICVSECIQTISMIQKKTNAGNAPIFTFFRKQMPRPASNTNDICPQLPPIHRLCLDPCQCISALLRLVAAACPH